MAPLPPEILSKPVVAHVQVPHERIESYLLFYVICRNGHLFDIHRVKRYRRKNTPSSTQATYWVARGLTWEVAKEKFELRMAALGIALPRDFFRDKQRPWR